MFRRLRIYFGYSQEMSHYDDYIEYPQNIFGSENKKINWNDGNQYLTRVELIFK